MAPSITGSNSHTATMNSTAAANLISRSKIKDLINKANNTSLSTQRQGALLQLADKLLNHHVISALAWSPAHVLQSVFGPLLRPQLLPRISWPGGRPVFKRQKKDINDHRSYRGENGRHLLTSFLASLSSVLLHMPDDRQLARRHYTVELLIGVSRLLPLKDDYGMQEEMALDEETAKAALEMLKQCLKISNIKEELRRVGPTILRRFWGPGGLPVGRRDERLVQHVMRGMALVLGSAHALTEMVEEGLAREGEAYVLRATGNVLGAAVAAGNASLLQVKRRHVRDDAASSTELRCRGVPDAGSSTDD